MNTSIETDFFIECEQTKQYNRSVLEKEILSHVLIVTDGPYKNIRCSRCVCTEIQYQFVQRRSADEGQCTRMTCTQCHFQWIDRS